MLNFLDTVEMKKNLQLLAHHLLHPNLLLLYIDGLMEHQTKPEETYEQRRKKTQIQRVLMFFLYTCSHHYFILAYIFSYQIHEIYLIIMRLLLY